MVVDGLFSYFILKRGQIGVEKVRVRVMMFNATITIFRTVFVGQFMVKVVLLIKASLS
jgi:hypothetical protein